MRRASGCLWSATALAAFILTCGCSGRPGVEARHDKPVVGKWGFDRDGMDRSILPGDDFYRYAGGNWMKKAQIPEDLGSINSLTLIHLKVEQDLRKILEEFVAAKPSPGTDEQRLADYYSSYLDTKTINELGMKPFESDLAAIAGAKTHEDVAALMGNPTMPGSSPIAAGPTVDQKNPDRYIVIVKQSGLGLPERTFYLSDTPTFDQLRKGYRDHVNRLLTLARYPDAKHSAEAILALETKIAACHWPADKMRDRELGYNLVTKAQLLASAPQFPWDAYLGAMGLKGQTEFVVGQPDAVSKLAKLFLATPVSTWHAYHTYHYLKSLADIMPSEFDEEVFAFHGKALSGIQKQRERWARGLLAIDGGRGTNALAMALGRFYVQRHVQPETRTKVTEIVQNLLAAYKKRIPQAQWMQPETRAVAMQKAEKVRIKVAFPDKWRDYSSLTIQPGDAYGNLKRANEFEWKRLIGRMGQKTERDDFEYAPQIVNAYYNPVFNEIVLLAAILQPPVYDPNADLAIIYGGLGASVGHEMGHGYDDQGAKSDERGVLRSWWQKRDEERFQAKAKELAAQFSQFEPLPGLHVNGQLTAGENIGDLSGLVAAFDAYHMALGGKEAPVLDGLTGDQRFFLGWAQAWRGAIRDGELRTRLLTDPHSPGEYRVNGALRNVDPWYQAFDIQPGTKLFLKPEDRLHIW